MSPALPRVHVDLLPYASKLQLRDLSQVDLVVIHCTEVPSLSESRAFGERILYADSGTGNSGHYYIDHDGAIHQYVDLDRVAHHVRGYNPRSIGIELVNAGRYPHWLDSRHQAMAEPYPEAQIAALSGLLQQLQHSLAGLAFVAGHEDLDTGQARASDDPSILVPRKRDPGPMFPWERVMASTDLRRLQHESAL